MYERISASHSRTNQPLITQAEYIKIQQLANDHSWFPGTIREVAHRMSGDVRSVYMGSGMDYEESRLYQSGDDLRFMNWRLSARTGQHYMKVFREEKRPATFILIDRRAAMRFGSRSRLKVCQALRVAAYVAFSALRRHCGVAGVVLNDTLEWFDTCQDDACVYHFLNQAARGCEPGFEVHASEPSLDDTIKLLQKMMVAGSDVCLLSDFHDISEASRAALLQLSQECNVTAIQVTDPAETQLPSAGKIHVHSNIHDAGLVVDTNSRLVQQQFHNNMLARQEKCSQFFRSLAIPHITISTDNEQVDMAMQAR